MFNFFEAGLSLAVRCALLSCIGAGSFFFSSVAQTYLPKSYWTFENSNPMKDSMNVFNLDPIYYTSDYAINTNSANTGVGKYLTLNTASSDMIKAGILDTDSAFTFEFLFRPGFLFNNTTFFKRLDGAMSASMNFPYITFITNHKSNAGATVNDELKVMLTELGRKSYGYYIDGEWHHLVFKFSSKTGIKEIWVDGQLPSGFSKTVATTGYFINNTSVNRDVVFNSMTSYCKYYGDIDEIAIYKIALPGKIISKHSDEALSNNHYSFSNTTAPAASPEPVTGPLDMDEFAPGHPSVTVSAVDQLKSFPVPRYKPGHTLLQNYNWMDPIYFGGRYQAGISDQQSVTNSVTIITELAKNYNYYLSLKWGLDAWGNAWIDLANQNPQWKTALTIFRLQLNPAELISSQNLSSSHYLQNASAQFLDASGGITSSATKVWRPSAPTTSYDQDGNTAKAWIQNVVNQLTRPIDIINENAEAFPLISNTALALDPQCVSAKNASGLDWDTWKAKMYKDNEVNSYRSKILSIPALANTKFTEYATDGQPQYRYKYSQARLINSQINGQYYATGDFYPRWASNWRYWMAAWHGWQWVVESRVNELAAGDNFFSPFVSAGWDLNEENNIRPSQWLGLLKCLGMAGAEFYYSSFFNEGAGPYADPKNYAWQAVIPPYSQAITSRYEDLFRNGFLMNGDVPDNYITPVNPGYSFNSGDARKLIVARKHISQNKYAITGTIQPNSSMKGNTELEDDAQMILDGQTLKFKVRRQGSTYYYDNTNTSAPVFYQLDSWHETTHPYYWTKDFKIEAELFDNTNTNVAVKTERPNGTAAGDFRNFTSYLSFSTASEVQYNFQPRGLTASTYHVWVRARSKDGSLTGMTVKLDNGANQSIGCVNSTAWQWYRYDAATLLAIKYNNVSLQNHVLKITPTNTKLEIDQINITTSSSNIYAGSPGPCSAVAATITANGATTFCQGSNVTLTASTGTTYLWSTGATTQSVTVTTSGSYVVTVTVAGVGTGISIPTVVTVNSCCSVPTGLTTSNIQTASAKLNWSQAIVADSFQVKYKNMSTSVVTTLSAIKGTQFFKNISGLSPSTQYKWWVRSKCGNTFTAWSSSLTFSTLSAKLSGTDEGDMINADEGEITIRLFPNPASGGIYIQFSNSVVSSGTVRIISVDGKELLSKTFSTDEDRNSVQVGTAHLPRGIYLLILFTDGNIITEKIILE